MITPTPRFAKAFTRTPRPSPADIPALVELARTKAPLAGT
jgi:hypothetical protein